MSGELPHLVVVPAAQLKSAVAHNGEHSDLLAPVKKYVRRLQNWFRKPEDNLFGYYLPNHLHQVFLDTYQRDLEKNGYKISLSPDRVEIFF